MAGIFYMCDYILTGQSRVKKKRNTNRNKTKTNEKKKMEEQHQQLQNKCHKILNARRGQRGIVCVNITNITELFQ